MFRSLPFSKIISRLKHGVVASAFITSQFVVPMGALGLFTGHAAAAPLCTVDTAGANDEPGQKDLTKMCVDYGNATTVQTTWNWDELGSSGANTLDACSLFDINGNGNIDYSVCVTTTGNPAVLGVVTTYTCGDAKVDRCTSPATPVSTSLTECTVAQSNDDPFPADADYHKDTQSVCNIPYASVGGAASKLIDVCSYPSGQPNSDPSDCVIAQAKAGKLEVKKTLVPATDNGKFNLQIDGVTAGTGANVGNGGTTGEVVVPEGTHTVGETAVTGTSLANYSTSIVCRDLNGTGTVPVASGTGTSLQLTVPDASDIVCVITNTRANGTLTLIKSVTNNDGGNLSANDFGLTIDGTATTSGTAVSVSPGSHTINEAGATGYHFVSITGTGCPATLGGTVSVASNANVTCTITNDDTAPSLTLQKSVSGGTSTANDWTLSATPPVNSGYATLSGLGGSFGNQTARANVQYTLSESGPSGYTGGTWSCNAGTLNGSVLTLPLDTHVTCSITNTRDTGTLILKKHVVNDNGGTLDASSFSLHVKQGSTDVAGSPAAGTEVGTSYTLPTGSYTVSEDAAPAGYTQTGIVCNNQSTATVNVTKDTTVTCTITNNDIAPQLKVIKHVINDNSGQSSASDFTMNVTGTNVSNGSFAGSESGTTVTLNQGSYSVSEGAHVGYAVTYSGDCSGSIVLDQSKTCTVTNNDIPNPGIHVVKSGPTTAHEGDVVTYTFTVTNTGDTPLGSLTVNDNIAGAGVYQSGDTNNNGKLDTTETWIYTKNYTIPTPQLANVDNTVTACGTDTDQANPQGQTCDTDNHTLDVLHPAITVVKSGPLYGYEGQTIGYTFVVTNTGDTQLTNVGIDDDIAIAEHCDATTLAVGAHTDCTAMYVIPTPTTGDVTNHVIASGTDDLGKTVTSNDQHTLTVIHPAIHVVKSGPTTAHEGDTVTYTFTVTNPGDIALSSVTVTDNVAGNANYVSGDTNSNNLLDTTETWIYTKNYVIPTPQTADVVNTATACGYDPLQNSTCDTDNHTLDVLHPSIHVVKSGPDNAYEGDTVTYTFTVTNTGDTPLDITTVNDNVAGDGIYQSGDTNHNNLLDLSETWVYTKDYTIPADSTDITNTVTVCADDSLQAEDCDTDHHTTHIFHPTISVTKYVYTTQESDNGSFNLQIDGTTKATGGDGTTTGNVLVTPGSHTVGETGANGTDLSDYDTDIECWVGEQYIGTQTDPTLHDVSVTGDQHAHCNIYNTRHAHLTIVKDAVPNDPQSFSFTLEQFNPCEELNVESLTNLSQINEQCNDFSTVDNFQLVDNTDPSTATHTNSLSPGWYKVTEANTTGWDLTKIDCGDVEVAIDGNSVSVNLGAGQNVSCTYTNTKRASLTITKDAQPDSLQMFNFTSDITGAENFSLMDDGTTNANSKTMADLLPGTYTVTEGNTDNWSLNGVTCGEGVTMSLEGHTLTVTLAPGANVTCTFTNAQGAVLGAVTPLVNTGNSIWVNFIVGLTALFTTLALAIATRRSAKA